MRIELKTARLLIRDFEDSDWSSVHRYASNVDVVKFMPWGPNTADQTRDFIRRAQTAAQVQPRLIYDMAIIKAEDSTLIGGVRLTIQSERDKNADLGYVLNPNYWAQGYATEASKAVLDFGFKELKLQRIWAIAIPENLASMRVLEKIGMQREGLLRQAQFIRGAYRDFYQYATLRDDQ